MLGCFIPSAPIASRNSPRVVPDKVTSPFSPPFATPCHPSPPRCRQLTGECGVEISDLRVWTATYNEPAESEGSPVGRTQLNLLMCAPFGEYELELDTESYSDAASSTQGRTSWEILNGVDEVSRQRDIRHAVSLSTGGHDHPSERVLHRIVQGSGRPNMPRVKRSQIDTRITQSTQVYTQKWHVQGVRLRLDAIGAQLLYRQHQTYSRLMDQSVGMSILRPSCFPSRTNPIRALKRSRTCFLSNQK